MDTAVINKPGKVLLALSGGVDSAACAHLLQREGWEISAAVMRMSELHEKAVSAARAAAETLGIPLTVLDLREEFQETVIRYFIEEYRNGRTPNPCVLCNPKIKFRALLEEADRQGCAYAATGHYAGIVEQNGIYSIRRSLNRKRDQSYMLHRLGQRELSRLIFPIGDLEKPFVREMAATAGLSAAEQPDSQENCFIEGNDYAAFIESAAGKMPEGDFIAPDGRACGRHRGLLHYTVGQRKGLGIALGRPVFVREIDPESNRIYLADAGQDTVSEALLSSVTFTSGIFPKEPFPAEVKIRSVAPPVPAKIFPGPGETARVVFQTPQRAVAKGQSLVIYQGELLLGGGFLE